MNKAAHLHSSQVTCVKFVPNGFNIVTASRTNGVLVIEEKTMQTIHYLDHSELSIPQGNCKFAVSPDGKFVAIGGTNGVLFVFNIQTGDFVDAFGEKH